MFREWLKFWSRPQAASPGSKQRTILRLEQLEARDCPSGNGHFASTKKGGGGSGGPLPGITFQAVEGTLYNGVVATIQDDTGKLANNPRQVTIDWGDGASTRGLLLMAGPPGNIEVLGQHTYADEGAYTVSVSLV